MPKLGLTMTEGTVARWDVAPGGRFHQVQTLPGGVRSSTVTGLAAGLAYSFRVRAHNSAGYSGYSNPAGATTRGNPMPAPAGQTSAPDAQ